MKLRWTKNAIDDLNHAYDYISADNTYTARDIITRIEEALSALMNYPAMGREGRCKDTRELIVGGTPFLVPYRVKKNTIEILAVIHHARTWPEEL